MEEGAYLLLYNKAILCYASARACRLEVGMFAVKWNQADSTEDL